MTYNAKNYTEQGGGKTVIGGILEIKEGATVIGLPEPVIPEVPVATTTQAGLVKQAENVPISEATTLDELLADLNLILSKLKSAGIMEADAGEGE
jgi:hypothetical protein